MRKFEVFLKDDLAQTLEAAAFRSGLTLNDFLSRLFQQGLAGPSTQRPEQWMPKEEWEAMVRGEACPLCSELASDEAANEYGHTIADMQLSRLRLAANQAVPGYCVLICKTHVQEPYQLDQEEQTLYFGDLMRAAQAIEKVFEPIKMNFQILGNLVPHLHCHLIPRYYGDPAPGRPIDPGREERLLTPAEYEAQIEAIRDAL